MTGDQGMRALQDAVTLGRQIAAELGDWTFDLQATCRHGRAAILLRPPYYQLQLTPEAGRVTAHGVLPAGLDAPGLRITVAIPRGPRVVAAEIRHRLLPRYLPARQAADRRTSAAAHRAAAWRRHLHSWQHQMPGARTVGEDLQWEAPGVGSGRISQDLDGCVALAVTGLDQDIVAPLLDTLLAMVDARAGSLTDPPRAQSGVRSGRREEH